LDIRCPCENWEKAESKKQKAEIARIFGKQVGAGSEQRKTVLAREMKWGWEKAESRKQKAEIRGADKLGLATAEYAKYAEG
jgi:hypothetical protein